MLAFEEFATQPGNIPLICNFSAFSNYFFAYVTFLTELHTVRTLRDGRLLIFCTP